MELKLEELHSILVYNPDNGRFTYLRTGKVAGSRNRKGYVYISVLGKRYLAHRLAWLYTQGRWPTEILDHINGDPSDNRLVNLREASYSENAQNIGKAYSSNKGAGLLGASWFERDRKWLARIFVAGKAHHLGYYDTAEGAHAAYLAAKEKLHTRGHERLSS